MEEVFRVEPTIGHVIRQARHEQQLTLEDVASLVGITAGALSHIESGRRLPNASNAARIAQVLGIPRETLLTMLDDEHAQRRRHTADTGSSRGYGAGPRFDSATPELRDFSSQMPAYSERPIEDLFEPAAESLPSRMARRDAALAGPRTPSVESMRSTARWSEDTASASRRSSASPTRPHHRSGHFAGCSPTRTPTSAEKLAGCWRNSTFGRLRSRDAAGRD